VEGEPCFLPVLRHSDTAVPPSHKAHSYISVNTEAGTVGKEENLSVIKEEHIVPEPLRRTAVRQIFEWLFCLYVLSRLASDILRPSCERRTAAILRPAHPPKADHSITLQRVAMTLFLQNLFHKDLMRDRPRMPVFISLKTLSGELFNYGSNR